MSKISQSSIQGAIKKTDYRRVLISGQIALGSANLLPDLAGLGLTPSVPREVNQQGCLEESRQLLKNVNQSHLALPSVKLVLQQTEVEKLKLALKVEIGLD